jgi:hypothetical protein
VFCVECVLLKCVLVGCLPWRQFSPAHTPRCSLPCACAQVCLRVCGAPSTSVNEGARGRGGDIEEQGGEKREWGECVHVMGSKKRAQKEPDQGGRRGRGGEVYRGWGWGCVQGGRCRPSAPRRQVTTGKPRPSASRFLVCMCIHIRDTCQEYM